MRDLSKISKVKIPPFVILISGLIIVGLLTALGGILHYGSELSSNSETSIADVSKGQDNELAEKLGEKNKETSSNQTDPANSSTEFYGNSSTSSELQTAGSSSTHSSGGQSSSGTASYVNVSLSINGNPRGSVSMKSGSNHCQVLSRAYSMGLISSLDMRYNSDYRTYGVYVIDGIGDPSSVWWVYKINGQSPPYGCSYMKVHGGDSVNWQYLKG